MTLGVVIGGTYAWLQLAALRKNEQRQREAGAPSVIGMVPGSMLRVAMLLITLVLVQVGNQKFQWNIDLFWLTVSLAVAYSIPFFWRLKSLMSRNK